MSSFFQEQFSLESIRREQQRASILCGLFVFAFLFLWVFFPLLSQGEPYIVRVRRILLLFLAGIAVYEGVAWNVFRHHFKRGKNVPEAAKFMNAFIEVSSLSGVLCLLAPSFSPSSVVLHTPITWFYFFFVVLSTLRLSFFLSAFTGLVAAVEYFLLSEWLRAEVTDPGLHFLLNSWAGFLGKSFVIFMSGLAAGYVALQIKESLRSSIQNLEHQNQIITLFGQQISREVVNEMLKQNGSLQSRLREVTVMFIDIRGFTSYAEQKTPQEVVAYQNAFFGIIIEVVNQYHGIINQFLGDGCMVTFGAPIALDNSCVNAVRAGLEIIARVEQQVQAQALPPTRVGIGLHVGEAVTGNIGTATRQQYSITGNVVILASRIEQLNKDFDSQMLVSEDVIQGLSPETIPAQPLGRVSVRGRAEEIFLYRLA